MYSIYSDGNLIYAPPVVNDGYIVYDASITRELNKVDTAEFTIPTTGIGYDAISKLKSTITIFYGDEKIFHGRCLHTTTDFNKQRRFYCEGCLGFLNDSILRPYSFSTETPGNIFAYYLAHHNSVVGSDRDLIVGDISTMQSQRIVRESSQYPVTLDELEDKLIENYGGYVMPRYVGDSVILDYKATSGGNNGQVIEFGKNLLTLEQFIDASEVKTVLIPLGATIEGTDEKLTIRSVNNNLDYLENSTAIATFGRVEACEVWDDITIAENLKTAGQGRLNELIAEATTLTLTAIDMAMLEIDTDKIRLGEYNRVYSVPHGLDNYFQCSRIVLNLSDPRQNEYTFGIPLKKLTDTINRYSIS